MNYLEMMLSKDQQLTVLWTSLLIMFDGDDSIMVAVMGVDKKSTNGN